MQKFAILLFFAVFAAGCQQDNGDVSASSQQSPAAPFINDTIAQETPDEAVIAVVNGVEIPASRIPFYARGETVTESNRDEIIRNIITSELIAQEAKKSGLAEQSPVRDELIIAEQSTLGRAYVTDFFAKNPVAEEQIVARYEELSGQLEGGQEYNAAHILVEDEAAANELLQQIKQDPQVFAELAREHSVDTGSGQNDGALGWVQPQALVPEFAETMKSLKDGGLSDAPVQTQFGWHIIRVDEVRAAVVPELTPELRQRIAQGEQADLLTQHIEALREQAAIELR